MANDFTKNPNFSGSGKRPRDFQGPQPAQKPVKDESLATESIPAGGLIPDAAPPPVRSSETATKKPFRVS